MLNKKELENKFSSNLKEQLMDKSFQMNGKFPAEIPKIVGDLFVSELLSYFNHIGEFDVKPIIQNNMLLVQVVSVSNNDKEILTLLDVIMPISINKEMVLTINNVLVSIKNL